MKKSGLSWFAGAVAAAWALGASATPVQISYDGFANGSRSGTLAGVRNVTAAAGQFEFDVLDNGGVYWDENLNAFCIDVTTNLVTSGSVWYDLNEASSSGYLNASQLSLISSLYDRHGFEIGDATSDAAFQLALWEIIYDYNDPSLTLGDSDLRTSTAGQFGGASGARGLAEEWLAGLDRSGSYSSSSYGFYVLTPIKPQQNQTLLVARTKSVPEPDTLALLGIGLIAVAWARRRRAAIPA